MPLFLVFLAGAGLGGWGLSQADDAIEVATGEKDSFPILQIILLIAALGFLWTMKKKFA